jgi:transposase
MFFDELSNDEWARLSALVSDEPAVRLNRRGRPRAEPRIVANAVLWILTTGEPWSKLPGRYPSGPTCRRRFEEWQANGTLIEMVRLLSETGRAFAYIPEPTPPAVAKPAPEVEQPKPRDDTVRGVYWKSPESWQTSSAAAGVTHGWRPLGAMADITRQLAGGVDAQTLSDDIAPAHDGAAGAAAAGSLAEDEAREAKPAHAAHAYAPREMLDTHVEGDGRYGAAYDGASNGALSKGAAFGEPQQFDGSRFDDRLNGARALDGLPRGYPVDGHDGHRLDGHDGHDGQYDRDAYAARTPHDAGTDDDWGHSRPHDLANYHAPLWMNLAMPGGAQFDDERGYVIYVVAEQVASSMYRAWAEIMRDGRRIERSGLIGPRFEDDEAARRFALEWAIGWIDRECGELATQGYGDGGAAVAEHAQVSNRASVNAETVGTQRSVAGLAPQPGQAAVSQAAASAATAPATVPVTRAMPESAAVKNALPASANRNGSNASGGANGNNGGASGTNGGNNGGTNGAAQSPGTSSYPQHVNAHRMQLRRYPSEGNNSASSADKTTDRFPPTRKLLSQMR